MKDKKSPISTIPTSTKLAATISFIEEQPPYTDDGHFI